MKKKLFFFIGSLQAGGAERVISELTRSLTVDYDITIILFYHRDVFYNIDNEINIIELESSNTRRSIIMKVSNFRKIVKRIKPDLIISFLTPFNIFCFFSLLGIDIPLILCERSDPRRFSSNIVLKVLRDISYKYADGVVFQTYMSMSFFSRSIQNNGVVIPNPRFIEKEMIGKALRVNKEKKIVCVARLIPAKNLSMLIKAFSRISSDFNEYKLVIYGEGIERNSLQDMIDELDLHNRIILYGKVKNVCDCISNGSFFVLSSDYEGMSNALMEAISVGLPVISTRVSGASDMIVNGKNGFLIDIGDIDSLVIAMKKMIMDSDMRDRMGYESVKQSDGFDFENILDKWKSYIKKSIKEI